MHGLDLSVLLDPVLGKERRGMNNIMCDSLVWKVKVIPSHLHHLLRSTVSLTFRSGSVSFVSPSSPICADLRAFLGLLRVIKNAEGKTRKK